MRRFILIFICLIAFSISNAEDNVTDYWRTFQFYGNPKENPEFRNMLRSYLPLMARSDSATQKMSVINLFSRAEADRETFGIIAGMLDLIYNYPNSPYRNNYIAECIYESVISSTAVEETDKENYSRKLGILRLNSAGRTANDFETKTPEGDPFFLHEVEADYTVLFFYNPDCESCYGITASLHNSKILTELINKDKLKLFAVYLEEEYDKWLSFTFDKPEWLHGWDSRKYIEESGLYILEAVPSIYLLDNNKKVIMKDCSFVQLELWLRNLIL